MHITNFVLKAIFSVAVLSLTTLSVAHEGHHSTTQNNGKNMPSMNHQAMSEMNHSQHSAQEHAQHMQMMGKMNHGQMNHAQHQATSTVNHLHHVPDANTQQSSHYDHRSEHGAQIYAITTVDNKWFVNEDGTGGLKSEFETRIGTDEKL